MRLSFHLNQEVSSSLALVLVFVLATAVALGTVTIGVRTLETGKASLESDMNARNQAVQEALREKRAPQKGNGAQEAGLSN